MTSAAAFLRKQLKKQRRTGQRPPLQQGAKLRSQRRPAKKRPAPAASPRQRPLHRPTALRAFLVWGLLMLGVVALGIRLAHLQLVQGPTLSEIAQHQQRTPVLLRQARRPVVDRSGNVLAVDRVVYTLYAHPQLFKKPPTEVAEHLSPLLEVSAQELQVRFMEQKSGIQLGVELPEEVANRVRDLRLDGLELTPRQQRFYPQQELFAPIVGFVNLEGIPQAGLEAAFEEQLSTEASQAELSQAAPTPETNGPSGFDPPLKLQLTLDSRLQRVAQQELQATVAKHGAKRGTALVMDAHTGEMLAFAITPTYDPNRYYEADITAFRNWAVSDLYEPGSTFKPINIAIALEVGAIQPEDGVYDEGRLQFGQWTIQNSD
ncbi:MAG TPA: penicillin-binding transpeptidase domain-containing protein, partial [Trichocoleus sp.]